MNARLKPRLTPAPRPDGAAARSAARKAEGDLFGTPAASPGARNARIALAAYYRAEARGFEPGMELDDWLAAETELDAKGERVGGEIEGVSGGRDAQPKTA
ncbi:MAG TPA: DUF2934 domain-containing protein [Steroidobacteraceae bacterium]|nr:DUF2934 domain-containing protein [Steroidobacteraceae bacterium]